ncbi:MAG: hypothetical protein LBM77_07510 [Spirochaetaceae bacterium]|jgi:uncharacterized protein (DUF4415 family)|nr:hypothetical protein [Spirochaetaceae bacterium]
MGVTMKTIKDLGPIDHEHLKRLKSLKDDEIDCSEIPPLTPEQLSQSRSAKVPSYTVHIAPDVYKWYRSHSSNYEESINAALRREMAYA